MVWTTIFLCFGFTRVIEYVLLVATRTQAKLVLGLVLGIFPETRIKFGLRFRTVHSKFEMGLPLLEAGSLEFCTPSVSIPPLA